MVLFGRDYDGRFDFIDFAGSLMEIASLGVGFANWGSRNPAGDKYR